MKGYSLSNSYSNIAVTIPCLNEEKTVGKVIDDFRRELPGAAIYVIDNCSTDRTVEISQEKQAVVLNEPRAGKGFAVENIFSNISEKYIVMVDGDDTYPADKVKELVSVVTEGQADMAVGSRTVSGDKKSFRKYHAFGNTIITFLINKVHGSGLTDVLSGYRVFNRKMLKKIPIVSSGFEVETELTLQTLYYDLKVIELPVSLNKRPEGSFSKLRTYRDGFRILWKIFSLLRAFKPLTFFGTCGLVFFFLGLLSGILPVRDYIVDPQHYISHVPLAILASGLCLVGIQFVFLGVLLHAINMRFKELHNILTR
jgi:glycosyltransferase involved in cell wall biosynthesis